LACQSLFLRSNGEKEIFKSFSQKISPKIYSLEKMREKIAVKTAGAQLQYRGLRWPGKANNMIIVASMLGHE